MLLFCFKGTFVHRCDVRTNYGENCVHLSCTHSKVFVRPLSVWPDTRPDCGIPPVLVPVHSWCANPLFPYLKPTDHQKKGDRLSVHNYLSCWNKNNGLKCKIVFNLKWKWNKMKNENVKIKVIKNRQYIVPRWVFLLMCCSMFPIAARLSGGIAIKAYMLLTILFGEQLFQGIHKVKALPNYLPLTGRCSIIYHGFDLLTPLRNFQVI